MRCFVLSVLFALSVNAQFEDLAVTDDGRLHFWSRLREQGSAAGNESKIYRLTGSGFELLATAPRQPAPPATPPEVYAPFVSGDGSRSGYNEYRGCNPRCGAIAFPRNKIHLTGVNFPSGLDPQTGQLSRNGRYFLGQRFPNRIYWINFENGHVDEIENEFVVPAHRDRAIANDGTALVIDARDSTLAIYHPSSKTIDANIQAGNAASATISPDSAWYAFEQNTGNERQLILRRRGARESRILARMARVRPEFLPASVFHPSFDNGNTLLYLEHNLASGLMQLALTAGEFGEVRRFAEVPEGVRSAILAGAGHTGYAVTNSGRLLRLHPALLTYDELLPETPQVAPILSVAAPGSAVRMIASGLRADTEISIGGVRAPVTSIGPRHSFFQVPWDAPPAEFAPLVIRTPGHPFEVISRFTISGGPFVRIERETFVSGTDLLETVWVAHQDFRGFVTRDDPARPGEILHIFATNLGPVETPQRTGEPAPITPVRITTPFACNVRELIIGGRVEGAVLPFVGLAPGTTGFYQVDLAIPADWPASPTTIECFNNFGARDAITIVIRP